MWFSWFLVDGWFSSISWTFCLLCLETLGSISVFHFSRQSPCLGLAMWVFGHFSGLWFQWQFNLQSLYGAVLVVSIYLALLDSHPSLLVAERVSPLDVFQWRGGFPLLGFPGWRGMCHIHGDRGFPYWITCYIWISLASSTRPLWVYGLKYIVTFLKTFLFYSFIERHDLQSYIIFSQNKKN